MPKPFNVELSQRLDQVVAAVERIAEIAPSPAKDKALAKWQENKAKLEKAIFDNAD